jgi:uncharacterized protein (TIGR02391 family)
MRPRFVALQVQRHVVGEYPLEKRMSSTTWPPPTEEVKRLPIDELAMQLLRRLAQNPQGLNEIHRGNLAVGLPPEIHREFAEAYDWLAIHGLVSVNPGESTGWGFITRRGRRLAAEPEGLARLRAEERLDVDLHPKIGTRAQTQFLLGEPEAAVLIAMREVEINIRDLAGLSDELVGKALVQEAFKDGGPLCDSGLGKAEQEAMLALFRGALGTFKNPTSHREVDYGDATFASEVVLLADLLLRLLDRTPTARRRSKSG